MTSIEQFAARWWSWAIAASWQVGLLVCLIAVLRFCCAGLRRGCGMGCGCWCCSRFFLPTTLSVSWGVGHWGVTPIAALTKTMSDGATPLTDESGDDVVKNLSVGERVADVLSGDRRRSRWPAWCS